MSNLNKSDSYLNIYKSSDLFLAFCNESELLKVVNTYFGDNRQIINFLFDITKLNDNNSFKKETLTRTRYNVLIVVTF